MLVLTFCVALQLAIGFLLRERPLFALATVATAVVSCALHRLYHFLSILHFVLALRPFTLCISQLVDSGNLDYVSICCCCFNGAVFLFAAEILFYISFYSFSSNHSFWCAYYNWNKQIFDTWWKCRLFSYLYNLYHVFLPYIAHPTDTENFIQIL